MLKTKREIEDAMRKQSTNLTEWGTTNLNFKSYPDTHVKNRRTVKDNPKK